MGTFRPRPSGVTLGRPATAATVLRRRVEQALHDPHGASERFDQDFVVALVCQICGRCGTAPMRHRREAIREHVQAKHAAHQGPVVVQVVYPKQ